MYQNPAHTAPNTPVLFLLLLFFACNACNGLITYMCKILHHAQKPVCIYCTVLFTVIECVGNVAVKTMTFSA